MIQGSISDFASDVSSHSLTISEWKGKRDNMFKPKQKSGFSDILSAIFGLKKEKKIFSYDTNSVYQFFPLGEENDVAYFLFLTSNPTLKASLTLSKREIEEKYKNTQFMVTAAARGGQFEVSASRFTFYPSTYAYTTIDEKVLATFTVVGKQGNEMCVRKMNEDTYLYTHHYKYGFTHCILSKKNTEGYMGVCKADPDKNAGIQFYYCEKKGKEILGVGKSHNAPWHSCRTLTEEEEETLAMKTLEQQLEECEFQRMGPFYLGRGKHQVIIEGDMIKPVTCNYLTIPLDVKDIKSTNGTLLFIGPLTLNTIPNTPWCEYDPLKELVQLH